MWFTLVCKLVFKSMKMDKKFIMIHFTKVNKEALEIHWDIWEMERIK